MKNGWFLIVALMSLLCGNALAQGARDEARALAREGIALLEQGKHQEGLAKLEQAESKFHAPTHLIYMARAHTALGNHLDAHRLYIDVLVEAVPNYAPEAFHAAQKDAARESKALEPKIAALRVRLEGAERARVTVDGTDVPQARLAHPIGVEAGRHRVEATAGAATAAKDVDASVGSATEVVLELTAAEGEPAAPGEEPRPTTPGEEPTSAFPIGAGVAFGIGGAALVVGTVTGILTLQRADEIKASCTENVCPPEQESEASDAKVLGNVSTAMFAIGGAGVALGAVFLILGATEDEQARVKWRIEARPTGMVVRGTF